MKINRENYPLYFLDHFEGRLSEEGRRELLLFLENHPDLKEEFDAFEMVGLEGEGRVAFPGKESLKRTLWLAPVIWPLERFRPFHLWRIFSPPESRVFFA